MFRAGTWVSLLNPGRSLRARLGLLFGGMSLLVALVLAGILGYETRLHEQREVAQEVEQNVARMRHALSRWLCERYDDVRMLASMRRMQPGADRVSRRRALDEYCHTYPSYLWIGLLDRKGFVLTASGGFGQIGDGVIERGLERGLDTPYVGSPRTDEVLGARLGRRVEVVDLVVPVTDNSGHSNGALWACLDWESGEQVKQLLQQGKSEQMMVVRGDGQVLLPPGVEGKSSAEVRRKWAPLPPELLHRALDTAGEASALRWPDGKEYLTAARLGESNETTPSFDWAVVARESTAEAFAGPVQLERNMMLGGLGVGLLFAMVGWAAAGRLVRPVSRIAAAAERLRHGDAGVEIPHLEEEDEVGALAESLRKLLEERQRAQSELEAARDEAEAASAAKDQFLAVLSHELRTPLTPVLMALGDLDRGGLSEGWREDLEMIRRNVELEAHLIDDLLDLTRIARGKMRLESHVVDLHATVEWAMSICRPEVQAKRVKLRWRPGAAKHHVMGDGTRLQQVMWNLLKNAVKFTPEGGQVTVETADTADGRLRVSVTDTGIGISADAMPRLFNAFQQGESGITRKFGGLGLGLAISRALVDAHGGRIEASSPGRGHGATFSVELPTVEAPKAEPAGASPPNGHERAMKLRILLVEDHADTAGLLARYLRTRGHKVVAAGTVAGALEAAGQEDFDLLISDLGLPDGSGTEVMKRIRQSRSMRGIVISGFGTEGDKQATREAGFEAHLTKPIQIRELERVIGGR